MISHPFAPGEEEPFVSASMSSFMWRLVNSSKPISRILDRFMFPPDLKPEDIEIIKFVSPFTMTKPEMIYAMIEGIRHVVRYDIPGDIVECGVWKGGSTMAAAKTLLEVGNSTRRLHLFDTFEGNPEPTDADLNVKGETATAKFSKAGPCGSVGSKWCNATLDEAKRNVFSAGYDNSKIHFVKGKVEDTILQNAPERIALLRLDTDF